MEIFVTAKEVAMLMGKSDRYIREMAKQGAFEGCEVRPTKNKVPQYFIPLSSLEDKYRLKYIKNCGAEIASPAPSADMPSKPLDSFSQSEREEMSFWIEIIERWQSYRNAPTVTKKTEIDERFVSAIKLDYPDMDISVKTLYRKWKAYKENRWEDLVDERGKHRKGQSKLTKEMMDAGLYFFLDQAEHPVSRCYQYMKDTIKEVYPEQYELIPSEATFRRHLASDIDEGLKIMGRKGEKAYRDLYGLYIRREYDQMESNEYWIGDTHTFDVQSRGKDGGIHRLYLSAWMDARSAVMVGWHISTSPSSQTSILALRDGMIRRRAIPQNIYVDNGREFLTFDFGGAGHRAKKPKNNPDRYDPPTILKRLGIEMTNAIVKNARAKTIERRFLDFKNQVSRLFATFTGGNVVERPEILKAHIKNGNVVIDEQLIEEVNTIIEYYFNYEEYGGAVSADRGKRKIDVYNEHCIKVRRASEDELNLMLMRSTRAQKVGRRGIYINVGGERFDYVSTELKEALFGKQVYCRYDPYNLSKVRVYDLEDRFIMEVPCTDNTVLNYGAGKEDIKVAQQLIRAAERRDKDKLLEIRALGHKTARELVLARAMENKNNPAPPADPQIYDLHRAVEEPLYKQAVGGIDLNVMNRNAKSKRGGNENE